MINTDIFNILLNSPIESPLASPIGLWIFLYRLAISTKAFGPVNGIFIMQNLFFFCNSVYQKNIKKISNMEYVVHLYHLNYKIVRLFVFKVLKVSVNTNVKCFLLIVCEYTSRIYTKMPFIIHKYSSGNIKREMLMELIHWLILHNEYC